jgi:general secretion pathway protein K
MKSNPQSQRGAALITVMLIFSMSAIIAFYMLSRQMINTQRTATIEDEAQAYQYALGAEELARQVLASDASKSLGLDYPGQEWGTITSGVPVDHGTLEFSLQDLQGRFNLNTLMDGSEISKARFTTLMGNLDLPSLATSAIIERFNGSDAMIGASLNRNSYQVNDITLLRQIPGMTEEYYQLLLPHVTAIPEYRSLLNVNSASPTVMRAYIPDQNIYERLMNVRVKQGYISDIQLRDIGMNTQGMSVISHYFLLTAEAKIGGRSVRLSSIINRKSDMHEDSKLRVISRDMSKNL